MLVSDYNYDLPEERIAKFPPKERGTTRLLVLNRQTGAIQDSYYRNLDEFLNPGDVLILNDTRVMQSRLFCELPDGRKRELVVLEKHGDEPQRVMYRGKLHEGDVVFVEPRGASGRPVATGGRRYPSPCQAPDPLGSDKNSITVKKMLGDNVSETVRDNGSGMSEEPRNRRPKEASEERTSSFFRGDDGAATLVDGRDEASRGGIMPSIVVAKVLGNGIAEVESETPLAELAERYGTVPLPPYLHRDATESDKKRYQTVWAKNMGSAAAPTASLNMTEDLLRRLKQKGVIIKYLTLHVGLGTFLPIRSDKVEDHHMHSEWYHIPDDTLDAIRAIQAGRESANASLRETCGELDRNAFSEGGPEPGKARGSASRPWRRAGWTRPEEKAFGQNSPRVVALGTTVARTLEYYARTGKPEGEDDIFIYPGFEFQLVDALITNYHAPKSTVLMLASAFAGWDHLKAAYDHALAERYNFLSYGDSMLIC